MGWRSLFLTDKEHIDISIDHTRLRIHRRGDRPAHLRIEDINFILIDSYDFNISGKALEAIATHNIPLVLTSSKDHLPILQLVNPYAPHHRIGSVVTQQAKLPRKTRLKLWQSIISYKIRSQGLLIDETPHSDKMATQALQAKSEKSLLGIEGSWAKFYWRRLVDRDDFTRVPKVYGNPNDTMNAFLNYTYAILRARIASAIAENGMLPLFSIFHRREYNAFALADDLIEPYRWCADKIFADHVDSVAAPETLFLTPNIKKIALSVLHMKVHLPYKRKSYSLDEAIRIGIRAFKEAMLSNAAISPEEMLCRLPR